MSSIFAMIAIAESMGLYKFPKIEIPRPPSYKIHLTKSERKGKTYKELQRMRIEKIEDWGEE